MAGRKRAARSDGGKTLADELAEGIANYRQHAGLSQTELAERLTALGVPSMTQRSVAKVETGGRAVSFEEAVAFAIALEVPLQLLFLDVTSEGQEDGMPKEVALTPTTVVPVWRAWRWWAAEELLPGHTSQWAHDNLEGPRLFASYQEALRETRSAKRSLVQDEYVGDRSKIVRSRAKYLFRVDVLKEAIGAMERAGLDVAHLAGLDLIAEAEAAVHGEEQER